MRKLLTTSTRHDGEGIEPYNLTLRTSALSDHALLKLCQCIAYNIDEDKILDDCISALKEKIITESDDYKKGAWSI